MFHTRISKPHSYSWDLKCPDENFADPQNWIWNRPQGWQVSQSDPINLLLSAKNKFRAPAFFLGIFCSTIKTVTCTTKKKKNKNSLYLSSEVCFNLLGVPQVISAMYYRDSIQSTHERINNVPIWNQDTCFLPKCMKSEKQLSGNISISNYLLTVLRIRS